MKFTFVSNYINHHQIPFCEAMRERLGDGFRFLQTMPMEEERRRMGWGVDLSELPYVSCLYDDEAAGERLIEQSDIVLFGWTERMDLEQKRLESGRPVIRESERLYREGQWKAVSPRGLLHKYSEHIKWRGSDCYLLCAGAYTASDFALLRAYPGKMYSWGYFPPLRTYTDTQLKTFKAEEDGKLRILWAGRFLALKHPEYALKLAEHLKARGIAFHLDMIGSGDTEQALREQARQSGVSDSVAFLGFLPPQEVRAYMERAQIFLFTSNHLEGWGAVVSEAMNSACAVVAGSEAGAVPSLIRQGVNGVIYRGEDEKDFLAGADWLCDHPDRRRAIGEAAYATIRDLWNAETAADRLTAFSEHILDPAGHPFECPDEGPLSRARIIRPYMNVPELK
ncbi:MAG: glycosyltransferase family 4 protein [Lachnospiraceae bacterium]|jgi:glycosyltransferase involved in cell wall biosynthesis|nr:glycosyltransferase family 4 protein [Lachnospiraceae bacterium]